LVERRNLGSVLAAYHRRGLSGPPTQKGTVAHGLAQGTEAEVSGSSEDALAGAYDEAQGAVGERVLSECDTVELTRDEGGHR